MSRLGKFLLVSTVIFIAAVIALKTGFARQAFFELFSRVKGVDVLGPTTVRVPPGNSPYQRWLADAQEEIPVFEGMVIPDVNQVELGPWPQLGEGMRGLYLHFADYQINDGRLLEIPAGGATLPQRQFYEKGIFYLGGPGHTVFQQEGAEPQRVDWNTGSLFSIPLNVRHQHFNDSEQPVRLLVVTSFPYMINSMNSTRFIDENPFVFFERYDGGAEYLLRKDESTNPLVIEKNFIYDTLLVATRESDLRGKGNRVLGWNMAGNSMLSLHIAEMPPKMYKKAHRHISDAFILLLSGEGFSITWPEGSYYKRQRIDWQAGTLFVPPTYWYHQHLNSGSTPARYLAINASEVVKNLGLRLSDQLEVDEPEVRAEWEEAMDELHQPDE